jgi:hypothetical protein
MPTLTKPLLLQVLAKALAADPTLTVEKLNAPQEVGSKIGTLTAAAAIPVLAPEALRAILDLAVSDTPAAANAARDAAIAWQENLSQGEIALTEGSQGRKAVDALVTGKVLTEVERTTLIGLATEKFYGATLGETLGIGRIYPENLDQARAYAAKQQEVTG